ncbi:hypothetical protein Tco_1002286 [Tanacetum coccineum]|uniref:DUF4219 domain-containing protein n=1 Tax=Tanacetum coccineum TaxID=301880 RepID=A0ABQ5F5V9_9ASTR
MSLSLAENVIVAGANNRPPMLDKNNYSSWASRMLLYIKGKENGKLLVDSVLNGPFQYGTMVEPGNKTTLAMIRARTYTNLTDEEKIRESFNIKATNIVLQGLPQDIYNLVNHNEDAKQIWDRVKLLIQGSELSLQELVHQQPYQVSALQQSYQAPAIQQPSSKELDSGLVVPSFNPSDDPIANLNKLMTFVSTSFGPRFHRAYLDPEQLAFLADNGDTVIPAQASQAIPTPTAFQTNDLDAFDSDCDDVTSTKAALMANLSSYDSYVLSKKMKIRCSKHTSSSAQQDELLIVVIEEMSSQVAKYNMVQQENLIVYETLTAELERYKEQEVHALYDGHTIVKIHVALSVTDTDETLELAEDSRNTLLLYDPRIIKEVQEAKPGVIKPVAARSGMDSKMAKLVIIHNIGIRAIVIENKVVIRTISSPNRSTFDIEDAFSLNIYNYTCFHRIVSASSGSSSFNSSENSTDNMIPPVFSSFYNNPYLKDVQAFYAKESPISSPDPITSPAILTPSPVLPPSLLFDPRYFFVPEELLPPKKRIYSSSSSLTMLSIHSGIKTYDMVSHLLSLLLSISPSDIEQCSIKMYLKHHEGQIKDILNYLDELYLHHIEKMEEGRIDRMIIRRNSDELKTELKKIRTQIIKLQKKRLGQKDKIAFAHYRISDLEQIIEKIQARHQTNQEDL